ncbi:hypothetical protein [Kaistia granuli]|uniref:hypothetical protein n=1 Tax=Kaistia granuli TaxID=363259 RepID=UPI00037F92F2|nr:hypothetical protein [Kaistia granuli]
MTVSRAPFATTLSVIPAKAGIHTAEFAGVSAGVVRASTSKAPAEWIPAFAGMTSEGVIVDASLLPGAACGRAPRAVVASRSAVIPEFTAMTSRLDLQSGAR